MKKGWKGCPAWWLTFCPADTRLPLASALHDRQVRVRLLHNGFHV